MEPTNGMQSLLSTIGDPAYVVENVACWMDIFQQNRFKQNVLPPLVGNGFQMKINH